MYRVGGGPLRRSRPAPRRSAWSRPAVILSSNRARFGAIRRYSTEPRLKTDRASSELALRNGVKLQLGAGSRVKVWENRALLEKGVGQVAASAAFEFEAAGLKIRAAGDRARLRVALADRVEIAAVVPVAARVLEFGGVLMATIPAGRSVKFFDASRTRPAR